MSRLAQCFQDGRDPDATIHTLPALLAQRILGIELGYEDINDHDQLRHDFLQLPGSRDSIGWRLCVPHY